MCRSLLAYFLLFIFLPILPVHWIEDYIDDGIDHPGEPEQGQDRQVCLKDRFLKMPKIQDCLKCHQTQVGLKHRLKNVRPKCS